MAKRPHDFSVTRPSSFLPLASQLFVCLFLFRVAFGCSLRFGEVGRRAAVVVLRDSARGRLWPYGCCCQSKKFSTDLLVQISVLLIVAGFLAMTMDLNALAHRHGDAAVVGQHAV